MQKLIFITIVSIISIGCASYRNQEQNVNIIKSVKQTSINNKKVLIVNQFNDFDAIPAERLDLRDQYIYTYNIQNFYISATVLKDEKNQKIDYSNYDYILYNKLYMSKSEYPLYTRITYFFLFSWIDKRTLYLSSNFKDIKNKKESNYSAADTYNEIGFLVFPILPLFAKTSKEVKKEAFDNLNTIIFNRIYSDYLNEK